MAAKYSGDDIITASIGTGPSVVLQVTSLPLSRPCPADQDDLRAVRLRILIYLGDACIANLVCVRDARSQADLGHRPVSGPGHHVGDRSTRKLCAMRTIQLNGGTTMSYYLIGEVPSVDGTLFVLWTPSTSGVRVLPIGSRARRDMQAVGRRLIDAAGSDGDPDETLELVIAGVRRHPDGHPLQLVDLDDPQRQAIAQTITSDLAWTDSPGLDVIAPR